MKQKPEKYPMYTGALGVQYTAAKTIFRLWAPAADRVLLQLYEEGNGDCLIRSVAMEKAEEGTWVNVQSGDLKGIYYTYLLTYGEDVLESADPYAAAAGVNGVRSMVVDLKETDPKGFEKDHGPKLNKPTDAIICELSIRDTTEHPSWGGTEKKRGKFLGMVETGTKSFEGNATGLDYIKDLGVTHVQLMPIYDFCSIDESRTDKDQYNWGYDPLNYNVPEGSYSSNPFRGEVRIRECKEMIAAYHRAGIGVVMDVVYNHTFDVKNSCLQKTAPDYFYRKKNTVYTNGSGCGNELATERPMVRKYILDSLKYWVTEYHVDGFRFDLMGVFDLETLQQIQQELREIHPEILLYGEGWTGGESLLPEEQRAVKGNAQLLNHVAMFSDDIRDTIKGSVFSQEAAGLVNGRPENSRPLRYSIVGAAKHSQVDYAGYVFTQGGAWAGDPCDTVNYVSCHDNLTLWDKLQVSMKEKTKEERMAANRQAAAVVFTSQGIPFFLSGEDFARSKEIKNGVFAENSYNLSAQINAMDYGRLHEFASLHAYYKGLIAFRKKHPLLRLDRAEDVQKHLQFTDTPEGIIHFELANQNERILVVHNAGDQEYEITQKESTRFDVYVDGVRASAECLYTWHGTCLVKGHTSMVALVKKAKK